MMQLLLRARSGLAAFALAGALALPASVRAQAPMAAVTPAYDTTCSYAACALRIQHRLMGSRIVMGSGDSLTAGLGMFPPRLEMLATGPDSVRLPYEEFRRYGRRAALWRLPAIAAVVAGTVLSFTGDGSASFALGALGFGFGVGSSVNASRSLDQLSIAVWRYNAALRR